MRAFSLILGQSRLRHLCLLFLLVLLFGGLGGLRAEVSEPDSLRGEHIGAFDRETLERSFGLVRFRSSTQARYALALGDEKKSAMRKLQEDYAIDAEYMRRLMN